MEQMTLFGDDKNTNKAGGQTPAFGIDLGTTNSCISVVGGVETEILLVDGKKTLPSCVMWEGGDTFVVGTEAHKKRGYDNVSYSVKRIMGSDEKVTFEYKGETKIMEPYEVSAEILKALVLKARKGLYKDIEDVVITVPAYFTNRQMEETLKAGKAAGLNVLNLMKEPTAAALCYNRIQVEESSSKKVLIYDLGGGTFDVSLVEIINNTAEVVEDDIYGFDTEVAATSHFQVLGVRGDMLLGGDDVDLKLFTSVIERAENNGNLVRDLTKLDKEQILLTIERLKKSGRGDYNFTYGDDKIEFNLRSSDFDNAFGGVYDTTKRLIDELLDDLGMHGKIDQIITVGGSTKSEVIRERLQDDFTDITVNTGLEPDLGVTFGAAIQAKRKKFNDDTICVLDCIAMNIGILCDDEVKTILPANSLIPSAQTCAFQTQEAGQNSVHLEVYQGISKYPEECSHLGQLVIEDLELDEETGIAAVSVQLSINTNGILELKAKVEGKPLYTVELVNVLGATDTDKTEEPKRADRKLTRWKRLLKQMNGDVAKNFETLLGGYEDGSVDAEEVADFVAANVSLDELTVTKFNTATVVEDE